MLPSTSSDEYKGWKENEQKVPTIHSYYISSKGNILGLIPNTYLVTSIEGPFKSFNPKTRVITSVSGDQACLPLGKEEKTNMPCKIHERTKKELNRLSK